ncbi:MAG: diversity-generating retroelement protein Avd [Bryobacteraceae bacterium]|nr:diversity-generating retroelement protein Avd [Bryobacteraceae bacterium]
MAQKQELPVVVLKAYDFTVWLVKKVEHFPRSQRFGLGERLNSAAIDLLLRLVDAAYAKEKAGILLEVNAMLNRIRFLLRLAKDLNLFTLDSYGHAAEILEEIGRMAGGWRKVST